MVTEPTYPTVPKVSSNWKTRTSHPTTRAVATSNWIRSLSLAGRWTRSSTNPSTCILDNAAIMPMSVRDCRRRPGMCVLSGSRTPCHMLSGKSRLAIRAPIMGIITAQKMPTPPRLGIAVACCLWPSVPGVSSRPRLCAHCMTSQHIGRLSRQLTNTMDKLTAIIDTYPT